MKTWLSGSNSRLSSAVNVTVKLNSPNIINGFENKTKSELECVCSLPVSFTSFLNHSMALADVSILFIN